MPSSWNRSRATAIASAVLLHLVVAAWLLAQKFAMPPPAVDVAEIEWIAPREPLPPPPPVERIPFSIEAVPAPFILLPVPESEVAPQALYDFYGDAHAVAEARQGSPGRRGFAAPAAPERKLKSAPEGPPPFFEQPLPRVGTAVTTPEGETVLWVSDNCYISLGSNSLTMKDFHNARNGVRTCKIGVGKRKPRDDLFDHLKRKMPPGKAQGQPPGEHPAPPAGQQ